MSTSALWDARRRRARRGAYRFFLLLAFLSAIAGDALAQDGVRAFRFVENIGSGKAPLPSRGPSAVRWSVSPPPTSPTGIPCGTVLPPAGPAIFFAPNLSAQTGTSAPAASGNGGGATTTTGETRRTGSSRGRAISAGFDIRSCIGTSTPFSAAMTEG